MEILAQIWTAIVAFFQFLAVMSAYLVVMHLLTTTSESWSAWKARRRTDDDDEDSDAWD